MDSRFEDKVCVQCGKEFNTGSSDCFHCGADLINIGDIPLNAVKTEGVVRLTNSVVCVNCNRMMSVSESDKGVCPSCHSNAVYPATPGFVYDEKNGLQDVRRAG